ncbi:hypothetical protein PCASD_19213 [Puccinia coronata f. sp. avenae]|uniref:Uncharacterized protein n=1 Tax=Puccinia coronata f. sp. avenae TaxID=200324 RepID=A0A2N5UKU6_9BASI|nr:hypothetical protein PCASD_19213 [Puccinia coronata f. sp. avenae]
MALGPQSSQVILTKKRLSKWPAPPPEVLVAISDKEMGGGNHSCITPLAATLLVYPSFSSFHATRSTQTRAVPITLTLSLDLPGLDCHLSFREVSEMA